MTKADRIRALAQKHPDWSPVQIGKACDCGDSYVRVALRQRQGGTAAKADIAYKAKIKAETGLSLTGHAYQSKPQRRVKIAAANARWYAKNRQRRIMQMRDYRRRQKAVNEDASGHGRR